MARSCVPKSDILPLRRWPCWPGPYSRLLTGLFGRPQMFSPMRRSILCFASIALRHRVPLACSRGEERALLLPGNPGRQTAPAFAGSRVRQNARAALKARANAAVDSRRVTAASESTRERQRARLRFGRAASVECRGAGRRARRGAPASRPPPSVNTATASSPRSGTGRRLARSAGRPAARSPAPGRARSPARARGARKRVAAAADSACRRARRRRCARRPPRRSRARSRPRCPRRRPASPASSASASAARPRRADERRRAHAVGVGRDQVARIVARDGAGGREHGDAAASATARAAGLIAGTVPTKGIGKRCAQRRQHQRRGGVAGDDDEVGRDAARSGAPSTASDAGDERRLAQAP